MEQIGNTKTHIEKFDFLREFVVRELWGEKMKWQIIYFGVIHHLSDTLYLIAKPYMNAYMDPLRVFIMKQGDISQMSQVLVEDTKLHVSSKSHDIITSYGIFSFNRENDLYLFIDQNNVTYPLHEFTFLS